MFICDHLELTQVRKAILADLYAKVPEFKGAYMDKMEYFRAILAKREVTPILAKLAFNVLRIYDAPQCYFWNHQRPLIPHPCELSWPGASVGSLLGSQNFLIPGHQNQWKGWKNTFLAPGLVLEGVTAQKEHSMEVIFTLF
ncbi:hypothetical protein B0H13DRAFT_2375124 [Mycena leptocephala]|nr:hypothetical protein B0H13DRAFT_2375124 [Mycena leptocephala]